VLWQGSVVYPERLRFDFSNNGPVSPIHLQSVEDVCKAKVTAELQVYSLEVPLQEAQKIKGLRAVFGEVSSSFCQFVGDFSELP